MRKQLCLTIILLLAGCGGGGSGGSGYDPSQPSGTLSIDQPTTGGTYTTFTDSVDLSGWRDPAISAVTWENLSSGAAGTGGVGSRDDICCFFSTCWDCVKYYWLAGPVPLQDGENRIRVFGDGVYADAISVTKAPSLEFSGYVRSSGVGQLNVELDLVSTTDPATRYTTYTDNAGFYRFRFVPPATYTMQPVDRNFVVDPCFTFMPASVEVAASTVTDFSLDRTMATISGRVVDVLTGTGLMLATLTLADTTNPALKQVSTNPEGYFTFTCVPGGQYGITPSSLFGSFDPTMREVTIIEGLDLTSQDFSYYR